MKLIRTIGMLAFMATTMLQSTLAQGSGISPHLLNYIPRISPIPVKVGVCKSTTVDLNGKWYFNPAPSTDFYKYKPMGWTQIDVPSEWSMQGFSVSQNAESGYCRSFMVPAEWFGNKIKLRCNAIYSNAKIYINGILVGSHQGGFTPFELDVTEALHFRTDNLISISVANETIADTLASGSKYACHQLGGINRGIQLFVLPEINMASLYVKTNFDNVYNNADLELQLGLKNYGKSIPAKLSAYITLIAPDGKPVPLAKNTFKLNSLAETIHIPISKPMKWDNEHPNLYQLSISLMDDKTLLETVKQKVGFRTVEVRGNELFVNGLAVKLRGSNHHEVYPSTGRSLPAGIALQDVKMFREGNVNLLRTCHYPPDEALMHAADSLGMFIECEAPFCWAPGSGYEELVCKQTAEMVVAYRNHPSVLFWSLANESEWGKHFEASSQLVRYLDPTRPQTFNYWFTDIKTAEEGFCEIANIHYPVHGGPTQARTYTKRPVYLGEDCHLNAYNRLELATDPGLRDVWGRYLREMWDDIDSTKGCLGQSIWSGIDDTFYMPNGDVNGYGTWGPIDGWRRAKPEFWGMKKGYSPIRILNTDGIELKNKTIVLKLHNRQNFANVSEMKIQWTVGAQKGFANTNIAPNQKGELTIKLPKAPKTGEKLEIAFYDARGFMADEFSLTIQNNLAKTKTEELKVETTFTEVQDTIEIQSGQKRWKISKKTGQLTKLGNVAVRGPQLMVLALNNTGETQMIGPEKEWTPFTEPCTKWECSATSVSKRNDTVIVVVNGHYQEAKGSYTFTFVNSKMSIDYAFILDKKINPRQIGLVFSLPKQYERFSWERKGYWDVYPADHIARLKGTVSASEGFDATSVGPRTKPSHPWRLDKLPYGNNDFCSTKNNVITASLDNKAGNAVQINAQAKQHVRCWLKEQEVFFLIADYSNGGYERFLRGLAKVDDKPLKEGDLVSGTVSINESTTIVKNK